MSLPDPPLPIDLLTPQVQTVINSEANTSTRLQCVECSVLLKVHIFRANVFEPCSIGVQADQQKKTPSATSLMYPISTDDRTDTRYCPIPIGCLDREPPGNYPKHIEQWELVRQIQARLTAKQGQGALL